MSKASKHASIFRRVESSTSTTGAFKESILFEKRSSTQLEIYTKIMSPIDREKYRIIKIVTITTTTTVITITITIKINNRTKTVEVSITNKFVQIDQKKPPNFPT